MSDIPEPPAPPSPPGPGSAEPPRLVVNVEAEMRASYLDYAMSVIIGRALPDVRDGLKPVHRRVLYAMQDLGNSFGRPYKKSARIVGDVIGKYHPHGDQSVYDALVRMAQTFSMRQPLVDGQGNFGSIDGDRAAAMRYTEVRMARLAAEMLADIDKDTVDFGPNYDESLTEPLVLPARLPNLLVNGSSGIAVGMATNIPPHNLAEIVDATVALIHQPDLTAEQLMRWVPGPDFPTGGLIYGAQGLRAAYREGRGSIQMRGRAAVEAGKRGERVVITEIPFQVNKTTMIEKIAQLVRDKRLAGISDIRDESDRDGMRVVVEVKRDAHAEVVLNQLYANTQLQTSFGFNMVAIVGGTPQLLSLREVLAHFLDHRRDVVTRRCRFELAEAFRRFNVVFGLLAAIDSIDRVIALVRAARDPADARAALRAEPLGISPVFRALAGRLLTFASPELPDFPRLPSGGTLHLNLEQAQAILDMRLSRLTGLERDKLAKEAEDLGRSIADLQAVLSSRARLMEVIAGELAAIKEAYASPRRTELTADAAAMSAEDLIADDEMVVTVSHAGYVKRNPAELYRAQHRGGRGKTAATTREEDFVESIFVASAHQVVLIFTDRGRVFWLRVHEIPQAGRAARGRPLVNLVRCDSSERVTAVLPVRTFEAGMFVVMATAQGVVKRVDLMAFANPRSQGIAAIVLDPGDHLIRVALTNGSEDILLATRQGLAARFPQSQARTMGRVARGVRGIRLKTKGDRVVGMVICDANAEHLLTICDNGFGKRTAVREYPVKGRGGQGVVNIQTSARNGQVAGIAGARAGDEVMVVTNRGMMIRTAIDHIRDTARSAQGVRIISTQAGEHVAALARIAESADGAGTAGDESAASPSQEP